MLFRSWMAVFNFVAENDLYALEKGVILENVLREEGFTLSGKKAHGAQNDAASDEEERISLKIKIWQRAQEERRVTRRRKREAFDGADERASLFFRQAADQCFGDLFGRHSHDGFFQGFV